jgi:hypothetical protein
VKGDLNITRWTVTWCSGVSSFRHVNFLKESLQLVLYFGTKPAQTPKCFADVAIFFIFFTNVRSTITLNSVRKSVLSSSGFSLLSITVI